MNTLNNTTIALHVVPKSATDRRGLTAGISAVSFLYQHTEGLRYFTDILRQRQEKSSFIRPVVFRRFYWRNQVCTIWYNTFIDFKKLASIHWIKFSVYHQVDGAVNCCTWMTVNFPRCPSDWPHTTRNTGAVRLRLFESSSLAHFLWDIRSCTVHERIRVQSLATKNRILGT